MNIFTDGLFRSTEFANEVENHGHCDLEIEVKINLTKIRRSLVFIKVLSKYYLVLTAIVWGHLIIVK
jgi:hypothetical protein